MITVYRFETMPTPGKPGVGIYDAVGFVNCFSNINKPNLSMENATIPGREWYFGFTGVYQITNWFTPYELSKLRGWINISVYEIDLDHVMVTNAQCVFEYSKAKLISTKSFLSIDESIESEI